MIGGHQQLTEEQEHRQRKLGILDELENEAEISKSRIEWLKKQAEYEERRLRHTEKKIAFWKQEIQKEKEE